jgi:guanylate kinase
MKDGEHSAQNKGQVIVISGPSGVGKSTLVKRLLALKPRQISKSISVTTRPKRPQEVDGREYIFKSRDEFMDMVKSGDFVEHAIIYGEYYGTPRRNVEELMRQGKNVLLEIDTQGAQSIRKLGFKGVFIFVVPPTLEDLGKRLSKREEREENSRIRLKSARQELEQSKSYDLIIINDNIDDAVEDVKHALEERKLWD